MNKTEILDINIERFFQGCVWDFKTYPDKEVAKFFSRKKNTIIDLSSVKDKQLYYDIRDIFICCMINKKPYAYTAKAFPYLLSLAEFMTSQKYESFNSIQDIEKATAEWLVFLNNKGVKKSTIISKNIKNCYYMLLEFRDNRKGLDRNIWNIDDLKLNDERINKSSTLVAMNFWTVINENSRELLKTYFKYLLGTTELSYATINSIYYRVTAFFNFFKEKSLKDISHDDITTYRIEKKFAADANNRLMNDLEEMYKYLSIKKLYSGTSPIKKSDYMVIVRKHKNNTVPDETIIETFRYLHTLRKDYLLIYLINVFTGIRISDICQLTTNCIIQNENGYFLFHDVQKMQDVGGIPICKELYNLIMERITQMNKIGSTYLFPADKKPNLPYCASTYRSNMQEIVNGWNIKLPNGEPYHFVTHAFRHTIATQLYKMGMPSSLIQLGILHHTEINMSRSYIDTTDEMQLELLTNKGVFKPQTNTGISKADSVLPNGYCHMPANIQCPNISACLNCKYFRTSIKFLDVHKKHLETLNEKIEYYKQNHFTQNLTFALSEKEKLELIIAKLEEIKGDERNDNSVTNTTSIHT